MTDITPHDGSLRTIRAALEADARGTFAPVRLPALEGFLLALRARPGHPAPTPGFDIRVSAPAGYDVAEGAGMGRPSDHASIRLIRYGGVNVHPTVALDDILTLHVDGHHPPGARVVVELVYGVGPDLEELTLLGGE